METSYKEKYEQALSVARETYQSQPMYREWLEKMFPELKESEDEKIREALIRFHKSTIDIDGIKGADIISWLEKQGEQKPSDEEMKTLLYTEYEKGRADVIAEIQNRWSEEDKSKRNALIGLVEEIKRQPLKRLEDWDGYISWLKSLRPQNNWKPSDEQMVLLSEVQNALLGKDCHNRFTDFMWELKKLKEGKV